MNGTLGPRSEKVQAFAKRLSELTDIEVVLYDERLSTANAHTILNITNTRGAKRKDIIDAMSASLILQSYLDRERENKNG
jgi:putative Holliday junction resolvase